MNKIELSQFLRQLWLQGIEFWLESDQLRFRGNKHIIGSDVLAILKEHKTDIIELIKSQPEAYLGFPLSHGQRGIFLMQNLAPESPAFNLACLLTLKPGLQIGVLQSSLDFLLQRHAPLRMSIQTLDGHLAQQVSYSLPSIFHCTEQAGVDEAFLQTWLNEEADKPFQLATEPLIRARLLHDTEKNTYHFLLVAHHIIADFWAMDVLVKELALIYQAALTDSTPTLPEIGKLYKDFVMHENEWLQSEQGLKAKAWWNDIATPIPSALEFPSHSAHSGKNLFTGTEFAFSLGNTLTAELKQQAKKMHVTPFVWLLSIYQLLLHRYTGEDRIAIGSPMACRNQRDFQVLAGHFTNPVLLLSNFAEKNHFHDLLGSNKEQLLQAMKYQEYPLQVLLEDLSTQRENPSAPLFQAAISWNQLNALPAEAEALIDTVLLTEQRGAIYDLVLTAYDKGDNIQLSWRYNIQTFSAETIHKLGEHLRQLVSDSCKNPAQAIGHFDFLTANEKQQLHAINQTDTTIARNINLAQLFRNTATQYTHYAALKDGDITHSYAEIEARSNQMAHYLIEQGIKPRDHIALCLYRSLDMLVAILGTLKTGCTYIPIDSNYPNDRIAYMAMQSHAPLLISCKPLAEKISTIREETTSTSVQFMEDIHKQLDQFDEDFDIYRNGECDEDDVACVLYTSGSTGKPKGVKTPHRAIIRLCSNTNFFEFHPGERFLYLSNISFDATNIEIWGSFINGGCLIQVNQDTLLTPSLFSNLIEKEKPHAALITTALFNLFISYKPDIFSCFNYIFVGGEALDINPVRRCIEHGKPKHLLNIYGPTENGTISTTFDLTDPDISIIPIGKPISNSQIYVFDKYRMPTPMNVLGEIFAGGDGIATGYQDQPELTAERFIADTFRGKGLLYATGDLGYFREDGQLMYAGRRDDQVKIRGYRIELGEIEQTLSQHPHINECCVLVNKDADIATLHAYYSSDIAIDSATIKAFLRESLPEFMIPSATLQLDALPITPNGKLDKRKLPGIKPEEHKNLVAPRNTTEQIVSDIWKKQLNIQNISVYDNFFELGGHSLLAIKVAGDIQSIIHCNITMRMLFEHPTVAELAEAIDSNNRIPLPGISVSSENLAIPASLNQQRLWFLQQLNPGSTAYNMPIALRIVKPVDREKIQQSIAYLINRHSILRTNFRDDNGIAFLNTHTATHWKLPFLDLGHLNNEEAELQSSLELTRIAQHHFDLANEFLFTCKLIRLSANEHILAFCLHHLIADGISVDILLSELAQLWHHENETNDNILPIIDISYADFSAWQHDRLKGDTLASQLNYWKTELQDAPTLLNLPTDKARPAVLGSNGAEFAFNIPALTVSKLKNLSYKNGATLFMTLLAAYSLLLSRYSQQKDICIGFPIAGRTQKALEPLVGLFVNNLVARCNLADNISVNALIQQVKQTTINAYAHQDAPFDLIVDALKIERSMSYIPFLQASFSFEISHFSEKISSFMGPDICHEPLDWHVAKYDLHLSCFETNGNHLAATIDYNTELFEASTIEKISLHYLSLLDAICANPETGIDQIQFLSELEFQQQMDFRHGWNATQYEYPDTASVQAIIEQQAHNTPNAIAVYDNEITLSYHALNCAANQLAHFLRQQGIGRNKPVAVLLDRSVSMSIALLAILKAGGAYVPITRDIPESRVHFICNDTQTTLLISHSSVLANIAGKPLRRINIDESQPWADLPSSNPEAITHKDDIFNIIYTSGSTGNPKGVMVPHRGIINRLRWMQNAYPIGLQDKILQKTPYNFDVSVWELFWPLMQGSTLVYAKPDGHKNPEYLRDFIIHNGITTAHFVPSMLGIFLQTDGVENCTSLHQVFASGEALQLTHTSSFFNKLPGAQLINLYGPTEASIDVSHYRCSANETCSSVPIGKPIHNTQLHILDQSLNVLPIGVAGDLYIGGEGLASGYWKQDALTHASFIDNPWYGNGHPSKKLYKTGDLARYRSDGNIEYLGRSDHQIKIRGLRVELGEIETALAKLPQVQECLVLLNNNPVLGQRLVAYLLTPVTIDTAELPSILKASLPEYMIPSAFICIEEWPLSANGKIDRKRLPEPNHLHARQYCAARNGTEATLVSIWEQLLGTQHIGIHDNFFDLGGHSLLATQMASRIRNALSCALELKAIFTHPTIAELAMHILQQEINDLDMDDAALAALLNEL